MTGQQDFGPYQWRTLYETDDYGGQPSVVMTQLGNDRLKWERSKQFDVGLDYSFLIVVCLELLVIILKARKTPFLQP